MDRVLFYSDYLGAEGPLKLVNELGSCNNYLMWHSLPLLYLFPYFYLFSQVKVRMLITQKYHWLDSNHGTFNIGSNHCASWALLAITFQLVKSWFYILQFLFRTLSRPINKFKTFYFVSSARKKNKLRALAGLYSIKLGPIFSVCFFIKMGHPRSLFVYFQTNIKIFTVILRCWVSNQQSTEHSLCMLRIHNSQLNFAHKISNELGKIHNIWSFWAVN